MGAHNEFGKIGEQLAVDYLIGKGYKIEKRNYRYAKAEIDILAIKGSMLAVVEVKSRSSKFLSNIAEAVTKKKVKLLVMAADHFVITQELDLEVRFDIITIYKNKGNYSLKHIENAFYHF